jgi:hypothetical protein
MKSKNNYHQQSLFEVKSRAEAFALCKSGLHEFIVSQESYHSGEIQRLVVLSQGKQQKYFQFLIAKLYFEEPNMLEWEIIYKSSLMNQRIIYLGLKALCRLPKRLIRKRLEILSRLQILDFPSKDWYLGTRSQLRSFLLRERLQARDFNPYSGYSRHHNDHGNLPTEERLLPFDLTEECEIDDEVIFNFLIVGKLPSLGITFPDEEAFSFETVSNYYKPKS